MTLNSTAEGALVLAKRVLPVAAAATFSFSKVLGVIAGSLGIISFAEGLIPSAIEHGSTFNIAIGLNGHGLDLSEGYLPRPINYDTHGKALDAKWCDSIQNTGNASAREKFDRKCKKHHQSRPKPPWVQSGHVGEIFSYHHHQAFYTYFRGLDSEVCIAWVTMTGSESHGGFKYGIQGDLGKECGAFWSFSNMQHDPNVDPINLSPEDQPKCFWIGSKQEARRAISEGKEPFHIGFQVRWPTFGVDAGPTMLKSYEGDRNASVNASVLCDDVTFGLRQLEDREHLHIGAYFFVEKGEVDGQKRKDWLDRAVVHHKPGTPGYDKPNPGRKKEIVTGKPGIYRDDGHSANQNGTDINDDYDHSVYDHIEIEGFDDDYIEGSDPDDDDEDNDDGEFGVDHYEAYMNTRIRRIESRQIHHGQDGASQLIVTNYRGQSARYVCESKTSAGPDIVNMVEELFCDISEKKLYGFCNENVVEGCFDVASNSFMRTGSHIHPRNLGDGLPRVYQQVLDWRR